VGHGAGPAAVAGLAAGAVVADADVGVAAGVLETVTVLAGVGVLPPEPPQAVPSAAMRMRAAPAISRRAAVADEVIAVSF
jgi:hypothetical protein